MVITLIINNIVSNMKNKKRIYREEQMNLKFTDILFVILCVLGLVVAVYNALEIYSDYISYFRASIDNCYIYFLMAKYTICSVY